MNTTDMVGSSGGLKYLDTEDSIIPSNLTTRILGKGKEHGRKSWKCAR